MSTRTAIRLVLPNDGKKRRKKRRSILLPVSRLTTKGLSSIATETPWPSLQRARSHDAEAKKSTTTEMS